MNNKKAYKDMEKWRESCRRYKHKYYGRTSFAKNYRSPWTREEIEIVMRHEFPDRIISEMIGRSVKSIQIARSRENKKRCLNDG